MILRKIAEFSIIESFQMLCHQVLYLTSVLLAKMGQMYDYIQVEFFKILPLLRIFCGLDEGQK